MAIWEKPISEKQELAIRSSADLIFLTGEGGTGKTRVAIQLMASAIYYFPNIRIGYFINNWGEFNNQGGILKEIEKVFVLDTFDRKKINSMGSLTTSPQNMNVKFNNGTTVSFYAIEDISPAQLSDKSKTFQLDMMIFEEAQRMSWEYINILWTRIRNSDPKIPCKVYIIQNPERECAVRKMCGSENDQAGWINEYGEVIAKENCTVKYMFQNEGKLHETFWGKSEKECYDKCQHIIKSKIGEISDVDYKNFIFKVQFIAFTKEDNKKIFEQGKYLARLAQSSIAASMGDGNWNFSKHDKKEEEEKNRVLDIVTLGKCFRENPYPNSKIGFSADLSGIGQDNSIIMGICGFHVFDIWVENKTMGSDRANFIEKFMEKYNINMTKKNVIIDCIRFDDVQEYFSKKYGFTDKYGKPIPKKTPFTVFSANRAPEHDNKYTNLKAECASLLVKALNKGVITFAPELENKFYDNQRGEYKHLKKRHYTIKDELLFESQGLQFSIKKDKVSIMSKKEQGELLSKRSMDLIDPLIMWVSINFNELHMRLNNIKNDVHTDKDTMFNAVNKAFNVNTYKNEKGKVKFGGSSIFQKLSNW